MSYKSGFVTVIGRPNVGKSTLLNALLGEKMLIVSDKPQTTRNRIQCILTGADHQVVFIDTPGIHKPRSLLGQGMVRAALDTLQEVDLILFMVEAQAMPGAGDRFVAESLGSVNTPVLLVINKVDLAQGRQLVQLEAAWQQLLPQAAGVIHVSALTGYNLEFLRQQVLQRLPAGPQYYPEDMVIDQPERFIVAELVREKILHLTRDEVPHAVAVVVEEMRERDDDMVYVRANVYVERESQKGIIVGKRGAMLRAVGEAARGDIERLLGSRIYLDLWVKTRKDWRNQLQGLRQMGYEELGRKER
ncbi:MAG: GTPase Era [Bacillota bacterium]|jgi:GTP-binding protein Era